MDLAWYMHMVPAADVATLRKFHVDGLGWSTWGPDMPGGLMVRTGTAVIAFLNRDYIAAESGIDVSANARAINAVFVNDKLTSKPRSPVQLRLERPLPARSGIAMAGFIPATSPTPKATAGKSSGARSCDPVPTAA